VIDRFAAGNGVSLTEILGRAAAISIEHLPAANK